MTAAVTSRCEFGRQSDRVTAVSDAIFLIFGSTALTGTSSIVAFDTAYGDSQFVHPQAQRGLRCG